MRSSPATRKKKPKKAIVIYMNKHNKNIIFVCCAILRRGAHLSSRNFGGRGAEMGLELKEFPSQHLMGPISHLLNVVY